MTLSQAKGGQLGGRRVVIGNPKTEGHGMKGIVVKVCGSDREPFEVHLQPGVTAREVLAAIGLDATMMLVNPRENLMFEGEDELQVEDGDMLYARSTRYTLF
jgi:hypothetical protein